MKSRRIADLAADSDQDLGRRVGELKAELFQLRFQHAGGSLENPIRLREVRRDLARVLTLLRQRELAAARHG